MLPAASPTKMLQISIFLRTKPMIRKKIYAIKKSRALRRPESAQSVGFKGRRLSLRGSTLVAAL